MGPHQCIYVLQKRLLVYLMRNSSIDEVSAMTREANLASNAEPLLIGQPVQVEPDLDQSDLHKICKRIIEAQSKPIFPQTDAASVINIAESSEAETPSCSDIALSHLKAGTGYALLGGRTLSCLYRFVLVNESVRLLFKIPGLNQWQDAS